MQIPTIAPLEFGKHSPQSWHDFVKSLKQEPEKKGNGLNFSWTKTGKPSLRVTREVKLVLQEELEVIARDNKCPINLLYNYVRKKGITIAPTAKLRKKQETK